MAYAILNSLVNNLSIPIDNIFVNDIDDKSAELFVQKFGAIKEKAPTLVEISDVVILAVKPQQITKVLTDNLTYFKENQIIISIAAGVKISTIEGILNTKSAVIRIMPNTPALVGEGVIAISSGKYANLNHINIVQELFSNLGTNYLVEESAIDAITAISGSGPAYIFLIVEALINAGVFIGLDNNFTKNIVLNTVKGSIAMLEETSKHPAILREEVCSPAGTTIAAVKKLEENGLRNAIFEAVNAAYQKAQELSEE